MTVHRERKYDLFIALDCGDLDVLGMQQSISGRQKEPFVWIITKAMLSLQMKILFIRRQALPVNWYIELMDRG